MPVGRFAWSIAFTFGTALAEGEVADAKRPLAAGANAVYQATGVRIDRLALSPGNVLEALQARWS